MHYLVTEFDCHGLHYSSCLWCARGKRVDVMKVSPLKAAESKSGGAVKFLPPESCFGTKKVEPRHDIWLAFGFWEATPKAQPKEF